MRFVMIMLIALGLGSISAPDASLAQPAEITVEDCIAFDIRSDARNDELLCCYVFTLCIENVALDPIGGVQLTLANATQCVSPSAPDGWEVEAPSPTAVVWEAEPGDEIPAGVTLCGFQFSSDAREVGIHVELLAAGTPLFEQDLVFECDEDCQTPVETGTWGRIKAIYSD
jgi:hypothetical protein